MCLLPLGKVIPRRDVFPAIVAPRRKDGLELVRDCGANRWVGLRAKDKATRGDCTQTRANNDRLLDWLLVPRGVRLGRLIARTLGRIAPRQHPRLAIDDVLRPPGSYPQRQRIFSLVHVLRLRLAFKRRNAPAHPRRRRGLTLLHSILLGSS